MKTWGQEPPAGARGTSPPARSALDCGDSFTALAEGADCTFGSRFAIGTAEKNPQTAAHLDAQIAATDRQIDRLVYDLYGLTDEEVRLVEKA